LVEELPVSNPWIHQPPTGNPRAEQDDISRAHEVLSGDNLCRFFSHQYRPGELFFGDLELGEKSGKQLASRRCVFW